jgi:very-short-patch-repair endonuclease
MNMVHIMAMSLHRVIDHDGLHHLSRHRYDEERQYQTNAWTNGARDVLRLEPR